jgi:hypothetical protein
MSKRWMTVLTVACAMGAAVATAGNLAGGFAVPPPAARPWVYWFPLDGNITSNGITADLEAMARVGIGGVLYMETEQGTPKGPADFGGPLWRDLFRHALHEAARLGIEVNMNNDAGWCGSGGPWITPELSMQKLVWTATNVTGPARFEGVLDRPQAERGFYRDIAVLAHPAPSNAARIAGIKAKAAFVPARGSFAARATWPDLPAHRVVPLAEIRRVACGADDNGRIAWDVPAGEWTILRLGHTTTGKENHPAPVAGRGLECDKLSREAARVMYDGLMAKLVDDAGPLAGTTLVSTHIDSWEVGSQNWTPKLREEFRARRGYDPVPFLVTVTGTVVDSLEVSERFLWDLRQTISELLLDNYAGAFREMAREDGLRLSIEAYTTCPTDEMAYAGRCDEPMSEFWSWSFGGGAGIGAAFSCTEMASAAHVYGKPVLGAEAFTATNEEKWQGHPANIKALGDWAFCEGVNRFVFHRYALQPWTDPDRAPGVSMGPWGLHYERTQTWWEMSGAWHAYLARCQHMLQQGAFVADICLLGPEGSPQTLEGQRAFLSREAGRDGMPLERPGHNFDTCPPEALLDRASVRDGRIVFKGGAEYRILALPRAETMTPRLLRKIRSLVEAGATVVGDRPLKSPSLAGFPTCDNEIRELADALWGSPTAPGSVSVREVGRGRVVHGGEFAFAHPPLSAEGGGLGAAQWIWTTEGKPRGSLPPGKRFFRRAFTLGPAAVASARLSITADNGFECWMNGQSVRKGQHYQHVYAADVTKQLVAGTNVIAVLGDNTTESPNPAGLIAALTVAQADGTRTEVRTDASWMASADAPEGWLTAATPAGSWAAAMEQGMAGVKPWGDLDDAVADDDLFPDIAAVGRVLAGMGVPPDFAAQTRSGQPNLRFIHKRTDEADIYFVANRAAQPEEAVASFRVIGRAPELWDPMTGSVRAAPSWWVEDGVTRVPLTFDEAGSVLVVFRQTAGGAGRPRTGMPSQPQFKALLDVGGPWDVAFDPKRGAPAKVAFDRLEDWSTRSEEGIRHYSGTATYRKVFTVPAEVRGQKSEVGRSPSTDSDLRPPTSDLSSRLVLDLGRVEVMARVKLNGKDLGVLWKPPYRVDVTGVLKDGANELEIEVANLWINRQIGDEQLPEDSTRKPKGTLDAWPDWLLEGKPSPAGRIAFTSHRLWRKDDPLAPSGMIGPVRVVRPEPAGP